MNLGFAVPWLPDRQKTWSSTPYSLFEALNRQQDIALHDINVSPPNWQSTAYKIAHARYVAGRLTSKYLFSPSYMKAWERRLRQATSKMAFDAVLQIGDLGTITPPTFNYTDITVSTFIQYAEMLPAVPSYEQFTLEDFKRRNEWQRRFYGTVRGVFSMSKWMATRIIEDYGVAAESVRVVQAGINVRPIPIPTNSSIDGRDKPSKEQTKGAAKGRTILFVGRDFERKGGDLLLKAFALLQKEYTNTVQLVIAGPKQWVGSAEPPAGITFLGDAPWEVLSEYFATADVFCMPSRFEGFGLVFAEALCAGIPCIGRNVCAMPEIIEDGVTGYLLRNDDAHELAELLVKTLEDETMKSRVQAMSPQLRERYSWERVARDMTNIIRTSL